MTRRKLLVLATTSGALAVFGAGWLVHDRRRRAAAQAQAAQAQSVFVRDHSPVIGPADAPLTIDEYFDPSCESCRAFYPVVKQILAMFPGRVRLVIRYAPLHEGSDEAVRLIEAARRQNLFEPVLEALLRDQPAWAVHGAPRLDIAWRIAGDAGLDVDRARRDMAAPEIDAVLRQDVADAQAAGVRGTPTFFVNGRPLPSFGAQQLHDLVQAEVAGVR